MKAVCFVLISLILCTTANAETYFFVGSNFPILSEETAEGDFRGIAVDIVRTIGERLGYTTRIRLYPWARAQRMVKTGEADVLMVPYKTPEREKWLDYTENHFFTDQTFFYVRPGSKIVWNGDLSSLRGKRIGMVLGWSAGKTFEQAKDTLTIDYARNLDLCFKKLLAERIDIIPTQVREASASFARLGLSGEQKPVAILPELEINYNYFAFSKQKQKELSAFKKEFDRMLKQMKENGEISQLLKSRYGMSAEE